MSGSGGSYSISPKELKDLEEVAKKTIEESATAGRSNVFISFDSDDLNEVNLLRSQAKNEATDLEFNDHSVKDPYDSENADYIKYKIRSKIKRSSVLLVYITENTYKSTWVNWEVNEAIKLGKGVIAMHKGDSPPNRLPSALVENNISPIKWSHEKISSEIKLQKQ